MKSIHVYYGCTDTVLRCLRLDPACHTARRLAGLILRFVAMGKPDAYIHRQVRMRAISMHPFRQYRIACDPRFCTSDPQKAKVVLVVFSEFMCPVCSVVLPWLRRIVATIGPKVALCYKFFPISSHGKVGVLSCSAAAAAGFQGKFWPMHDILYKNRRRQALRHLDGYARAVGLDMKRYRADRAALATIRMVIQNKRLGWRVGVRGTPTLFLDGKRYRGVKSRTEIADRIAEELHLVDGGR